MKDKKLTFLSNRGVGLNSDLKMVESYLTQHYSSVDMDYRFFLKNGRSKNPMARQGFTRAKREFCTNMQKVICADPSLDFKLEDLEEGDVRLLLSTPYEYQFRNALLLLEGKKNLKKKRTFRYFTHILAGSPFGAELMKEAYDMEGIQLIEDVCLPYVWQINHEEYQKPVKKNFQFYFPDIKDKKIFAIIVYGQEPVRKSFLKDFDIRALIDKLGEDWFVMTNLEEIMEDAYVLDAEYRSSFGYVSRVLPVQEVLYIADVLLTNNGRFAGYYASRGKQIICPKYVNNNFEQYMEARFPELYLSSFRDFERFSFGETELTVKQREFNRLFAYENLQSPYETIADLLIGQAGTGVEKQNIL